MPSQIRTAIRARVGASGAGSSSVSNAPVLTTTAFTYTATTNVITNPERGWYHQVDASGPINQTNMTNYRTQQGHTLILLIIYLASFLTSNVDAATINRLQTNLNTCRNAGIKAILRFAYSPANGTDASPFWVGQHCAQFKQTMSLNVDVIACIQGGFVGQWGEWGNTTTYGDSYNMTVQNKADRKAVLDALLLNVSTKRMIQVRMPQFKSKLYTTTYLTLAQAFTTLDRARLGYHNDCLLSNGSDYGTYIDPANEYPYMQNETKYTVAGGETCTYFTPRSDCVNSLSELAYFHWSYLHKDYQANVIDAWSAQGCYSTIENGLGYRFVMKDGIYQNTAQSATTFQFKLAVENVGWASCYNPRNVEVVLRNAGGTVHRIAVPAADPRFWFAGTINTMSSTLVLPIMSLGAWTVFLNLPDPEPNLNTRPEYSIRCANTLTWETTTGYNALGHTLTVIA